MGTVNDRFTLELVLVRPVTGDPLLLAVPCTCGGIQLWSPLPGMYKYGDSRIYKESERGVW